MTNPFDTRPMITAPEGSNFVDLPAHGFMLGVCAYCDEVADPQTYAEYCEEWYRSVYEGEAGHRPEEFETWTYLRNTCLGRVENPADLL